LKVVYTAFLAVLVPFYWVNYGPSNFLWFCDVALAVTLIAIWKESSFLTSMQAVAIMLPQTLWVLDFIVRATTGGHVIDMTEYMFDNKNPLFNRALSFFHFWLPFLLVYMVWKLGYDRRAWKAQIGLCWAVLLSTFLLITDPNNSAGNVNKIFGHTDGKIITSMPQFAWVGILMLVYPICIYIPSHLVLRIAFRKRLVEAEEESKEDTVNGIDGDDSMEDNGTVNSLDANKDLSDSEPQTSSPDAES